MMDGNINKVFKHRRFGLRLIYLGAFAAEAMDTLTDQAFVYWVHSDTRSFIPLFALIQHYEEVR